MNLFYTPAKHINSPIIRVEGQEAVHAVKVMRHKPGDVIYVTDGEGSRFTAQISETGKYHLIAGIRSQLQEEREKPFITILIGLIKKRDRLEFAIEKCVELGANRIILFNGDHSEKQRVRMDRIESTALSGMKQSLRLYLPETLICNSLREALEKGGKGKVIMADETSEKTEPESTLQNEGQCILVVGPEGGFSEKERMQLKELNTVYCSLGKKRLRTETAAMVMVHRFRAMWS